ncbi:hypothetical protein ACWD6N_03445 [Micromonospora sp. NPDC005163]
MILNRWLEIIDQRIRAHASPVTKMGTVQSRDPSGPRAMVTLDGSTLAVPVKVSANVRVHADDRVSLTLFGSEWVVVASFGAAAAGPNVETLEIASPADTTFTTVNTDLVGASFPVAKELDATRMRVTIHGSAYRSTATFCRFFYGVRINGVSYDVDKFTFTNANDRNPFSSFATLPAIPAERYTVQVYGRTDVAAQTVRTVADDSWKIKWEEIV